MQALAQAGNGTAAYVDNLNEARKVLVEEAPAALFTIAKDVKIQVEFNPAHVQDYRLIGYETRKLKREDFNNDKVDAGEIGAGHAVTAIYEYTPVGAKPLVEDLRYTKGEEKRTASGETTPKGGEVAHLRIRYKLPDGAKSSLITYPVTAQDEQPLDNQPDDIRFAAAVTGFGQLVRGSKFAGDVKWDDVIELATAARGKDEYGYRMEFINLAKLAKTKER
jgi:Ca-activated chloride channel family protein